MLKKFNWGHGLFLFYTLFVIAVITVLIASTKVERNMVMEDYYSLDLAYQQHYDKVKNASNENVVKIEYDGIDKLISFISLDNRPFEADALFYRPSNSQLDFKKSLNQDSKISTKDLKIGLWVIKLDYRIEGKEYFIEQKIII
jgi:hypothetical protein